METITYPLPKHRLANPSLYTDQDNLIDILRRAVALAELLHTAHASPPVTVDEDVTAEVSLCIAYELRDALSLLGRARS